MKSPLGAIILTGGASSRMGADKALLPWNGARAVDRLAATAQAVGAGLTVTVGGASCGLPHVDEPDRGGPVDGIRHGLERLREAGIARVLVLAVDAPTLTSADLAPLLAATTPGAAFARLHLPLVLDIACFPEAAGAGWAMGRLVETMGLALIEPDSGAIPRLRGANTPAEREALLDDLVAREGAGNPGAGC